MRKRIWAVLICLQLSLGVGAVSAECNPDAIPAITPDSQLQDNGDGTITDSKTGLMWKQCLEGLSGHNCASGLKGIFTWSEALQKVQAINESGGFANFTDWRLPNIKELHSIVEYQCSLPMINQKRFPGMPEDALIWSSSSFSLHTALTIKFDFGGTHPTKKASEFLPIILVRSDSGNLADWTLNPNTGHYYKRVSCGSWKECESKAIVEGAHLVTINSAEENTWLIQTFGSDYIWIGFTDENSEGNWRWVSGEAVTYTNWADGEPNNLYIENQSHFTDGGKWNDLDGDRTEYTTDAIWELNK